MKMEDLSTRLREALRDYEARSARRQIGSQGDLIHFYFDISIKGNGVHISPRSTQALREHRAASIRLGDENMSTGGSEAGADFFQHGLRIAPPARGAAWRSSPGL